MNSSDFFRWRRAFAAVVGGSASFGAVSASMLAISAFAQDLRFTPIASGVTVTLNAVAFGRSNFVAVGANSTTVRSVLGSGGLLWASANVPVAGLNLRSIAYGNGIFAIGGQNSEIFSSSSGDGWVALGQAFPQSKRDVRGLAFNGGKFAAIADFVDIRTSSQLGTWTPSTIPNAVVLEAYRGIASFGNSQFATVGMAGGIRISQDSGVTWPVSLAFNRSEPELLGVASGGGNLVAVGAGGRIMVSTNTGATWDIQTAGTANLNAIAYTKKAFLTVGNNGTILTSANGFAPWISIASGTSKSLFGVAYAPSGSGDLNDVAIIVGEGGTILVGTTAAPAVPVGSDRVICPGNPDVLTVTVQSGATADWYSQATGGSVLPNGTGTTSFSPGISTGGTMNVFYTEARDLSNGLRSSSRAKVTLVVNAVPRITAQPGSFTACLGSTASFTVAATGTALSYQWRKGGVNINGATSATFHLPAVAEGDGGSYDVIVSGTCPPSVISAAATLTVNLPPLIVLQSASANACLGSPASLAVIARGTALSYQWRKGGVNINGATSATFNLPAVAESDAGAYDVVVSGACLPSVTSSIEGPMVINCGPRLSIQLLPSDQVVLRWTWPEGMALQSAQALASPAASIRWTNIFIGTIGANLFTTRNAAKGAYFRLAPKP